MKYTIDTLQPKLDGFLKPILSHAGLELTYELRTPENPHPEVENPDVTVNFSALPMLTLDPVGFQTNRAFKLCMIGETGTNYEIQVKTNLAGTNWTVLGTMQNTNGIWRFSDVTASNSTFRAYRARQLP